MIQNSIDLDEKDDKFKTVLELPIFDHEGIQEIYNKVEKKRLKQLESLQDLFNKRKEILERRNERDNMSHHSRKKKFGSSSQEEVDPPSENIQVEITELKYIEDELSDMTNYFQYKIETEAKNIPKYQTGKKYVVHRKFYEFELFQSCFTKST
uniref:PX domain-containing protein n=1 Tax=Euplotes crassus TaxID=5936 RepID=A0A7S3KKC8_EUPCR|mmetsp:Transcript_30220/g.29710  ORF Transcript_30220/g.29710 Transcript_30220/m.29710 type:complete len:153 (+) Transcript_30220:217-675(+)